MKLSASSFLVLLIAVVIVTAGTVTAGREEGDDVLGQGEHLAIPVTVRGDEEVEVRIFIVVSDGPLLDVFWMTEQGYDDYRYDQDFDHYVDYSIISTREVDKTFKWDGEGTYYVVIDNTASETVPPADPEFANATVHYVVTWGPVEESAFRDYVVMAILAVIVVFGVVLVIRYVPLHRGAS